MVDITDGVLSAFQRTAPRARAQSGGRRIFVVARFAQMYFAEMSVTSVTAPSITDVLLLSMSAVAPNEPKAARAISPRESEPERASVTPSIIIEPLVRLSPYKSLDSCHESLPTGGLRSLPTNSSNASLDSMPGPELPVHFSEFSIASDKDSYDPWSRMRDSAVKV